MTLRARDEADIVGQWLDFHLNAGADFVVVTDNRSQDGTTEILERYARTGAVHVIHEPREDLREDEWVTRMARLAATEFGADWVINSDADEFWWPRGASLRDVLAAVPDRYGTVSAFWRVFVPRPGGGPFEERMTVRFSALAPINDPTSLYRPTRKVIHRAHPEIRLTRGNHAIVDNPFEPLRGWFPVELFHFPVRDRGAARAQGGGVRYRVRALRRTRTDRVSPKHVPGAPRRRDTGLLRPARRRRGPARARRCRRQARRRPEAAGRAAADPRRGPARVSRPDARRGRRVRRGGVRARGSRRRPAPASPGRARAPHAHARARIVGPRVPEALRHDEACPRSRETGVRTSRSTIFVILTTQRSGSGRLVDLLDDHRETQRPASPV